MIEEYIYKWYLVINNQEVCMPTKEHALNLGRYLLGKNVPVELMKKTITLRKKSNGTFELPGDPMTENMSDLLADDNIKEEK